MKTDNAITCPQCGASIPLTEAISHKLKEQLGQEYQAKLEKMQQSFTDKENKLREGQEALEKKQKTMETEIQRQVASQKQQLLAEASRQAQEKLGVEMQDLRTRVNEQQAKLEEARKAELELRKKQRDLEEAKAGLELEVARKVDAEKAKITEQVRSQITEENRLLVADREKHIDDLKREINLLKQKAEQGSMQSQGEVLELQLENDLHREFITDVIEPVGKGMKGGDILQVVRTSAGMECGTIIWETKRTKTWSKDWLIKLREDQREAQAEFAVLASQALPPGLTNFGQMEGIWVCNYPCALALASVLRQALIGIAVARQVETGKHTKMEQLYEYLSGTGFRQQVEGLVETFLAMKKDLDEEKRAFTKRWAARDKQIEQAIMHSALIYGGVQGIVGQNSLPEIPVFQLGPPRE